MTRLHVLVAGILVSTVPRAVAQKLPVDLVRMSSALTRLQRYELSVSIRVVDSAGHLMLLRVIRSARDTDRYLYRFDSSLALMTPGGTILVDHSRRTIAYSRSSGPAGDAIPTTC